MRKSRHKTETGSFLVGREHFFCKIENLETVGNMEINQSKSNYYYCNCDPKIVNLNLDMLFGIPRKGFQSKYYSHLFGLLHQENAFSGNNIMCEERH